MIKKIITWKKWINPLPQNNDEEYIPENKFTEDEEEDGEASFGVTESNPVVITPIGIIPLKPFNNPCKVFNFWLGETNFNIGKGAALAINNAEGVELFDIFTRYKFRISVGNNFTFQDVKGNIEKALNLNVGENHVDLAVRAKLDNIINKKLKEYKYWAIYVLPNGKMDISATNQKSKEFDNKLKLYEETKKVANGYIIRDAN